MEKWTKYCKCEMPYNPHEFYVCCDGCDKWFHAGCIGVDEEEAEEQEKIFCDRCGGGSKAKKPAESVVTPLIPPDEKKDSDKVEKTETGKGDEKKGMSA